MTGKRSRPRRRAGAAGEAALLDTSFRALFHCNPVPMLVYDPATLRFVEANDSAVAQYGYTREQFLTKSITDLLPAEDRPTLRQRLLASEPGLINVGLRRHMRAGGSVITVDIRRQEFELAGRRVALVSCIDVSDRLLAEEQLRQSLARLRRSEEQLARAQEVSRTGSVERDLRTGAVVWSDQCYAVFGRDRTLPVPSRDQALELFHPDDRAEYEAVMAASERGLPSPAIRCRIVRADGGIRWVHHESEVIFGEDGRPARRIATFRDVTEAHEAEERQRQLQAALSAAKEAAEAANRAAQAANDELERRVERRTAELRAAQGELLKTERLSVLGQLTATVAHELRNPLSTIRNSLYVLRDPNARKMPLAGLIERIDRAVLRCEGIVTDLLEYTRVRALQLRPTKLDDWLGEILGELKIPAGIALERRFAAPGAQVALDADRFRRVVINLVENAAQAIEGGKGGVSERRITVSTMASDGAEVVIADTGPGIAQEILPKVFEPLFTTKTIGTGLGLPTVKQIVEQHGGAIRIASTLGQGTAVHVRLPLADAAMAAA